MHTEPARNHDPGIGLAHQLERDPVGRIGAQALADDRGAPAIRQKTAGAGDIVAIGRRRGNVLGRCVAGLRRGQHPECNQIAVGRRVRNVAGAQKNRLGKGPAHADQIGAGFWRDIGPGHGLAVCRMGRQQELAPFWVEMAVVPGAIFVDHGARRRVAGNVVRPAFAHDPYPAPVTQRLAIVSSCPHSKNLNS